MNRGLGAFVFFGVCALLTPASAEEVTIERAVELALRGNPQLVAADAQIRSAHARVGVAFAPYLPNINLNLFARYDGSNGAPVVVADPVTMMPKLTYPWANLFTAELYGQLDQRIWDFGRTAGAVGAARENEQRTRIDRGTATLELELAVFEAYTDALSGKAHEELQRLALERVDKQLLRATALFKATLRPEIDVLSAETQLAQTKIGQLQAQNSTANALIALRIAIGPRAPQAVEVVEFLMPPLAEETMDRGRLIDAAIGARQEIRSIERQIDAAIQTIRQIRGDYYPTLTLSVNGAMITNNNFWGPQGAAFGVFTVSQPLFSGWSTPRQIEDQRAQIDVLRANLEQQKLVIQREVFLALQQVQLARSSLAVATSARKQAERQLELAEARYDTKLGTFVELNDARNGVINATSQEIDAKYALSRGRGELLRRLGRSIFSGR